MDTSAIFAGIAANDAFHEPAVERWTELFAGHERLVTHSLVEVETATLLQRRIGVGAVWALRDALLPKLHVIEIERDRRRKALADIATQASPAVSLVDRLSFDVMTSAGITRAFTFDRHFAHAGFELIGPGA